MSIQFDILPKISSKDFVTEQVDKLPPTQQTLVATPPPEAASQSADVLAMMQQDSALARHSHPSQTQPPGGLPLADSVLDDSQFLDMPSTHPPDSPPLYKPGYRRGNATKPVENPQTPLAAISPAAIARLERSMKAFAIDDEGIEPPVNSTNEKKAGPISGTAQAATIQQKPGKKTFLVIIKGGSTKEYYRSQLTIPSLLKIGKDLADSCAYLDLNAHLFQYSNHMAYASITFHKRIDHAKMTYDELCSIYKVPPEQRVDLASLKYAVPLESLKTANTNEEIGRWEMTRIARFQIFVNKASINGAPADPALESIYRPTIAQRLALHEGHPDLLAYIACTDCLIFAYKRVL